MLVIRPKLHNLYSLMPMTEFAFLIDHHISPVMVLHYPCPMGHAFQYLFRLRKNIQIDDTRYYRQAKYILHPLNIL